MRIALAALTIALMLTGCGGTVDGTATKGSTPTADPSALDPGSYPTSPRPPLGPAGTDEVGQLVEGRRMAGFVVGPWQVDPTLSQVGSAPAKVVTHRNQISQVVWPSMMSRFPALPLVTGFVSERTSTEPNDPTLVRNAVLQYPFPRTAELAAQGLADGALNIVVTDAGGGPVPTEPVRAVPIPSHPDATGALITHNEGGAIMHDLTVVSAHGPYMLIQVVQFATPERAAELAGRVLDLQVPLIDTFVPTAPTPLATLPRDPSSLLARTVPLKPGQGDSMSDADYDPPGATQLEHNPIQAGAAMQDAGVDTVAISQTTVYQARDPEAAQRLAQALADDIAQTRVSQPAEGVPGIAGSRCVRTEDAGGLTSQHWCIATFERFTFKAVARELDSAHQQTAAQYLMLSR
ncbi:hypothetical protein MycrhN_2482 [Mycolicibacterium rhodesiae NBB3]|uniref:PknH-like extracellular domain-containing protein n=1 Tax=Mycolicibacterium rhodesiae (strain NBB3) TaxID=710685 RepID=G8RWD8_MYCRN|nr:hypothetical protein [Mycolicibacterium rhodesiae]AEV73070.1 hypothetical protein MycrhN_2482 [Mycolicibacterium rhodesiae NBB3]